MKNLDTQNEKSELETIRSLYPKLGFPEIMRSWIAIEDWLGLLAKEQPPPEDLMSNRETEYLVFQTRLMQTASEKRAKSYDDLYCKMVLWYRDAADLDLVANQDCRATSLLCSVLRDLTELTGQPDIIDAEHQIDVERQNCLSMQGLD